MPDTQPDPPIQRRFRLPAWAQMDNPIVVREMDALPRFLGADDRLNTKIILLALLAMGTASCSCTCGGIPWALMLLPLNLLPIIWGGMLISRERAANTWDMLRITPFSPRDLVLAKLSAATYRLSPLLAFLLTGQVISTLLSGMLPLFVGYSGSFTVSTYGSPVQQTDLRSLNPNQITLLAMMGVSLLAVLLGALLTFFLNLLLGALASTLTDSRGVAFAGALVGRIGLSALLAVSSILLAALVTGSEHEALVFSALAALGQSMSWLTLNAPYSPAQIALHGAIMLGLQAALLIGLLRLTVWRAAR